MVELEATFNVAFLGRTLLGNKEPLEKGLDKYNVEFMLLGKVPVHPILCGVIECGHRAEEGGWISYVDA